jgi:SAM-dependent methyltransferase
VAGAGHDAAGVHGAALGDHDADVSEWFEQWFGAEYLRAYAHRDDEDAERLVGLLEVWGVAESGHRVLDLGCGPGRHAAGLARRGARVVGLDLSRALLLAAREAGAERLVRADMRSLPLRDAAFDAVLNLFTSFGYFAADAEHEAVLREVARVLRPGGRFVLDFLNAPAVRAGLVARDERTTGATTVVQERWLSADGRFVHKRIQMGGDRPAFTERVRLYDRPELEAMMAAHGMRTMCAAGDYDGSSCGPDSERLILVGERT